IGDDRLTLFRGCDAGERLHVVARQGLLRIGDELVERGLVPDQAGLLQRRGVVEAFDAAGFPADDLVQVRSEAVVAFFHRVTRAAGVVELYLASVVRLLFGLSERLVSAEGNYARDGERPEPLSA